MAAEEKTGLRDPKYCEWHRSLPHNHNMLDFDAVDLWERTLFGVFSKKDEDGDDIISCLFECKEIQFVDGRYKMPYIDRNQSDCLKSFCKRYDKYGNRNDIPLFIVCYSINKETNERWFVVKACNSVCYEKLKDFSKKNDKSIVMSENDYMRFLSILIDKKFFRAGRTWMPDRSLID
jgi:hypothetical protein